MAIRLTQSRLRQIIKEELTKAADPFKREQDLKDQISDLENQVEELKDAKPNSRELRQLEDELDNARHEMIKARAERLGKSDPGGIMTHQAKSDLSDSETFGAERSMHASKAKLTAGDLKKQYGTVLRMVDQILRLAQTGNPAAFREIADLAEKMKYSIEHGELFESRRTRR